MNTYALPRFNKDYLKGRGLKKLRSCQAMYNTSIIVSYGLVVALWDRKAGQWCSVEGLHNYSNTTAKHIVDITGDYASDRRKNWVMDEERFMELMRAYSFIR